MLHDALQQLLATKSFEKISVGEIADLATLNRATFYDHYPDKLALLEGLVSTRFQDLLDQRQIHFDGRCSGALTGIALAMCDYMTSMSAGSDCTEHRRLERHFESALKSVVRRLMLEGLRRAPAGVSGSPELVAATIAGALYGGVSEWAQQSDRPPVEEAVREIVALVSPMLGQH